MDTLFFNKSRNLPATMTKHIISIPPFDVLFHGIPESKPNDAEMENAAITLASMKKQVHSKNVRRNIQHKQPKVVMPAIRASLSRSAKPFSAATTNPRMAYVTKGVWKEIKATTKRYDSLEIKFLQHVKKVRIGSLRSGKKYH
jgi:hypothetical protein